MSIPSDPEWRGPDAEVPYADAVAFMERRVTEIHHGAAPQCVWLLEHPPLYTAGTSARSTDLLDPRALPIHRTGRGGRYTYHGPGQRVVYVMLDLRPRGRDLAAFVRGLEHWIIDALARLGIEGERHEGRIGVWVAGADGRAEKIAAIGVRVRRWITYHGLAINVAPDLGHYRGIVPCGLLDHGVTSIRQLGHSATLADLDDALLSCFESFLEYPST